MSRILLCIAMALTAVACASDKPGEPCVASGEGFSRTDSCTEMCVTWPVTCPSGVEVTPNVCTGPVCGDGSACSEGFECVEVDSVPANARCLPVGICPAT